MRHWIGVGVAVITVQPSANAVARSFEADLQVLHGDLGSGEIFMECVVQEAPRNCFLDTGSNLTFVISDSITNSFPRIGEVKKSGASGSVAIGDRVAVSSYKLGKTEMGPVEIGRFQGARYDQLGMDVLKDGTLTLDFNSKRLSLTDTVESLPNPLTRLSKGHIALPIQFGTHSNLRAIFDTGAGLNSVDSKFVAENPSLFIFKQEVDGGYDINGHKVVMKLYRVEGFSLGALRFSAQDFLSFDFGTLREYLGEDTPLIIGFNGMQNYRWKFDLINSRFSVNK